MTPKSKMLTQLHRFVKMVATTASAIIMFFFTSCTQEIDIPLDSTYTRLVVWGEISSDTTVHSIYLTKTSDFFNPSLPQGVSNAVVSLSWNSSSLILIENDTVQGLYQTPPNFYALSNTLYRLNISNVDINEDGISEEYFAESQVREIGHIDSIKIQFWPAFKYVSIRLWAKDSITEDYYMIRVRKNGIMLSDSLREWAITNDVIFNGNNTNGIDVYWLDQKREDEKVQPGDTITLEISSIPKEYFDFLWQVYFASGFQTPLFSQTPGNVVSNISNGAMGHFAVIFTRRASVVVQ